MADYLTAAQELIAAGQTVGLVRCYRFDFLEGEVRLWDGIGPAIFDAEEWQGGHGIASVSDVPINFSDTAAKVTFRMAATTAMIARVRNSASVRGRTATIYSGFVDDALEQVDTLLVLAELEMDVLRFSVSGPSEWAVEMSAESIWHDRNSSALAYYSDRDQQLRFPGDVGLEFMSTMTNRRVPWPDAQ